MRPPAPQRGEVWMVEFNPVRGHEQAGTRPALVVSADIFNQGLADLVMVLPITSKDKRVRSHVPVQPPEDGLTLPSFILCEAIRSVAKERLSRRLGAVSLPTLTAVEDRLWILLGL